MGGDTKLAPLVLLAGGKSSRLGEPKGLVIVGGRPWIEHQLERFAACGGGRAIVVLGFARDAYSSLACLASAHGFAGLDVEVAINEAPERGPFSSMQEGARRARGDAFVLPIDVPCANAATWRALADAVGAGAAGAVPVHGGRGGHPVLLSQRLVDACIAMPPESRLDGVLRERTDIARVEVADDAVTLNLNTPADWERVR